MREKRPCLQGFRPERPRGSSGSGVEGERAGAGHGEVKHAKLRARASDAVGGMKRSSRSFGREESPCALPAEEEGAPRGAEPEGGDGACGTATGAGQPGSSSQFTGRSVSAAVLLEVI
eukprot:344475-Hanusia_phi.AAC.2